VTSIAFTGPPDACQFQVTMSDGTVLSTSAPAALCS
jgi:hypothetical protein